MEIGNWVHTSHNMHKITGFVIGKGNSTIMIQVTIPRNYGSIMVPFEEAWLSDDCVWMDDIPFLIDLSLKIKDEEWFNKWTYELSLWKPVGDVFNK
jgi:hypothetical protein